MADAQSDDGRALSFGGWADAYERARPGYPPAAARWLTPGTPTLVVELGAGTGKLTRALSTAGRHVIAVEPDERMRAVLSSLALPEVEVIEGFAESVPLGDSIAEVVVSGSSFHWFDLDNALAEAARLLTSGGTLAFAWNHPDVSVGWVRRMSDAMLLRRPWRGDRPWSELVPASGLFGSVEQAEFTHVCSWPRSVLADYVRSYSAVGVLAAPEREKVVSRVEAALRAEPELAHADELHVPFRINAYRARTLG